MSEVAAVSSYEQREALAKRFHACLLARDWNGIRLLVHDDANWVLPGDNLISGPAVGGDAVVERAKLIASFGVSFQLLHILVSRDHVALALRNMATRPGAVLDEYLATVCRLRGDRIIEIETYLSDVRGMNRFFSKAPEHIS
ncbi:nuclear transport factor 2 family protein [Sphingomonas sp. BN140010]|uniref:Nuclear transport factor 2 family protein n=1 Tax=Sphingomonas arvum TaxID=2992113 RepID=A0ABT3JE84_9SPHN|nr:nuclear transport factor 2 family protein [Sphingomonas sp. BN140010]MCW3797224.1 nuclear transport factor 2 family protein [Sphingomonas sp. BN140010]